MTKYRVKRKNFRYYPQYKGVIFWRSIVRFVSDSYCNPSEKTISYVTLDQAVDVIEHEKVKRANGIKNEIERMKKRNESPDKIVWVERSNQ